MVREWPFLLGVAQAREQENLLLPAPKKVAERSLLCAASERMNDRVAEVTKRGTAYEMLSVVSGSERGGTKQ